MPTKSARSVRGRNASNPNDAQATISPKENILVLNFGETFSETIVVTIPPGPPIQLVKLVPVGAVTPFVTSITPAGFGPLPPNQPHTLTFHVTFTGTVPCTNEPQLFGGALEVVVTFGQTPAGTVPGRETVVAKKPVRITVPECQPVFSYSVKFVCGVQDACECACAPVRPGAYATDINIYNYHPTEVRIEKFVVPLVFAGAAVGREPQFAPIRSRDKITLPPKTATMDDCCRIQGLLIGATPGTALPLTIGFLEIVANQELAVSVVYTASDPKSGTTSIDVENVQPRRVQ
jgi:hypothetical protein